MAKFEPVPLVTSGSPMTSAWANGVASAVNAMDPERIERIERTLEVILRHLPPEVRLEVDVLVRSE